MTEDREAGIGAKETPEDRIEDRIKEINNRRQAEAEAAAPGDPGELSESEPIDWSNTKSVLRWYGGLILKLSKRKESLPRLRAISSALSTLASLIRLNSDTGEIQEIRTELDALRRQIESENRPLEVVK